jgi:protein involved in polysaccharide export with SLBB domain
MSRPYLFASLTAGLVALGGWVLAQQTAPETGGSRPPEGRKPHDSADQSDRIRAGDRLRIAVSKALPNEPIRGVFQVEASGKVALGPAYGRVSVKDLTLEAAEAAIRAHLGRFLKEAEVQVTRFDPGAAGVPGRYAVSASVHSSVLVDTATGKTWLLERAGGRGVWIPARRVDSEDEAVNLLREQRRKVPEGADPQGGEQKLKEDALREKARVEDLVAAERKRAEVERQRAQDAEERARLLRQQAEAEAARARRALEDAEKRLKVLEQERQKERQK